MNYIFLADGFEEIEAIATIDILRRAGIDVKTVGVGKKDIKGAHNILVSADLCECDVCFDNVELVILPGGMPGAENLQNCDTVTKSLRSCAQNGGIIAAICAAPMVLGHTALLEGKRATCYPGFEDMLIGASFCEDYVVRDKNIITAKGPGATFEFAFEIVKIIKGEKFVGELRESMQCKN